MSCDFERQLVAMASDSEIRAELQKIEREFVASEIDGLGRYWWPFIGERFILPSWWTPWRVVS